MLNIETDSHYEIPKILKSQNKPIIWYLDKFKNKILKYEELYIIRYLEDQRFVDLGPKITLKMAQCELMGCLDLQMLCQMTHDVWNADTVLSG